MCVCVCRYQLVFIQSLQTNGHDPEVLDPPISFKVPDDIMKAASVSDLPSYKTEQQSVVTSFSGEHAQ